MKGSFTAGGAELAAAVRYCARWLTSRPASPEQGGLLFELAAGQLTISGFNENVSGRARVAVEADEDAHGAFVVAGRLVDRLFGTFGDKPVTIEQIEAAVGVSTGRYRATMPAMTETDYPKLAGAATLIGHVNGSALADAVRRVAPSARRDMESLVELNAVHLCMDDNPAAGTVEDGETFLLVLTATDRYQAARQQVTWMPADGAPLGDALLVLAPMLLDAADAFDGHNEVAIGWDAGGMFSLTSATRSLVGRTLPDIEKFPARQLAPTFARPREWSFTVATKDLTVPLKRADMLGETLDDSGSRAVHLTLTENLLTLGARSENGQGDAEVDVVYDGPPVQLRFKQSMLHTALGSAPGDAVTLTFTPDDPRTGVLVTSPGDSSWQCLMVPLRPAK